VTSREKFPGGETNLNRLLERAAVLLPQEEKSPEELAVASLLQLVAVALGRNTFRVAGLPELISQCVGSSFTLFPPFFADKYRRLCRIEYAVPAPVLGIRIRRIRMVLSCRIRIR
jgi:hypothetical protein